ncbi:PREDICTED: protein EMBRYO DEFECTIVE 1674 isoform X2 [Ipomoea nil]|uniref:protein EMBRYO DEFECTIVE 1674 isoform X2 n=1 Tax=Ipomoea nil TaxID=35883 RepID=UPI000900C429|nr:PREDICTED: protein EMBRYO DEFECTIVE 1674 isoform X2 [Ipomoea nil]
MEKFRAVPNQSRQNFTAISSSFLKEVYLCDWWLIKFPTNSKSERIGVAGFTFRESQDARIFHSAAISKRIDTVTLEAVDGIVIVVSGCINRSRTIQNGFPFEICNHFCVGFPYYWEEIAGQPREQSTNRYALPMISFDESKLSSAEGISNSDFISFDDLPATFLRDFCMTSKDLPAEIPPQNGSVASKNSGISGYKNPRASSGVSSRQRKDKVKKKPDRQSPKVFERSEGRITRSMTKGKMFQG